MTGGLTDFTPQIAEVIELVCSMNVDDLGCPLIVRGNTHGGRCMVGYQMSAAKDSQRPRDMVIKIGGDHQLWQRGIRGIFVKEQMRETKIV